MRLYLSVDMEGATGIVHRQQLMPGGDDWDRGRKLLTGDVAAVLEGAFEAGVQEALVNDAHGIMRNILLEELPEGARLISGPASTRNKPLCQTQGCDEGWDLAFFIGYHARAGARPGLLAHTWVGRLIHEVRVNGSVVGETGANATILGHHGIPVALVSGADDAVEEARTFLGTVETAQVKRALGPTAADCLPPRATRKLLAEAARRAVARRDEFRPVVTNGDVEISVTTFTRQQAEQAAEAEGVILTGERTFAAREETPPQAMVTAWRGIEMALRENPEWLQ